MSISTKNYSFVRNKLLNKEEIAFLDVREEDPHAREHPLFAANLPLSRIEIDAYGKLPKKDVPIVTLDDGEGYAELAAQRLIALGFSDVSVFEGGVIGACTVAEMATKIGVLRRQRLRLEYGSQSVFCS